MQISYEWLARSNRSIWGAAAAVSFLLGQGLVVFAEKPLAGGALLICSLLLAAPALFTPRKFFAVWAGPVLKIFPTLAAFLAAVLAMVVVKDKPSQGLWLFVVSGVLLLFAVSPHQAVRAAGDVQREAQPFRRWELWFLLALITFTVLTRFLFLNDYPVGAAGHEGEMVGRCMSLAGEPYTPYIQDNNINWPSLLFYQGLLCAQWFGWTTGSFRLPSAVWGLVAVVGFYFLARRLTSPGSAAIASLLFAGCSLNIGFSRWFFPGTILLVPPIVGLGLLLVGMRKPRWYFFLLAGAAAGISLHGYIPGRTVFGIFLGWFVWLGLFRRDLFPSWQQLLWFWGGFALSGGPVLYYAVVYPQFYWSYVQHANPNRYGSLLNYFNEAWSNLPSYMKMFHIQSDLDYSLHNAYDPVLDPVSNLLFPMGLFFCLAIFWMPVPAFLLGFLVLAMLPALLGGGFVHPTTRRIVMALPAIYLFAAMALERLRVGLNPTRSRLVQAAMVVVALSAATWSMAWGIGTQIELAHNPGVRSVYNYPAYLAGKEMHAHRTARILISPILTSPVSCAILMPLDIHWEPKVMEDMLVLDPSHDQLLLLAPYLEGVIPFFQRNFPNAQIKVFREENPDHPFYTDPKYANDYLSMFPDPFSRFVYLVSIFIPQADIRARQGLLDHSDPEHPVPVAITEAKFWQEHAGRSVRLAGAVISPRGEPVRFDQTFPGWGLSLDGRPAEWGKTLALSGGVHDFACSGPVPAHAFSSEATYADPLRISRAGQDLLATGNVLALAPGEGMTVTCAPGPDAWDKPQTFARQELFAVKRFEDLEPIPGAFSARLRGTLRVPVSGEYSFQTLNFSTCRVQVAGRTTYDNSDRQLPAVHDVTLTANVPAPWQADLRVDGDLVGRTFVLYYQHTGQFELSKVPLEWLTRE